MDFVRRTRTTSLLASFHVDASERKGWMFFTRVVPRRHEFSYCHAVTRGKNAIVGVAPRDAITGGIRGTRGLMPTIPTHAAATPCLCTKTTPLSPRWKEARLKFQPDTRPPSPSLPKSVCLREMCVRIRPLSPSLPSLDRRRRINRWNDHRITHTCACTGVSKCSLNETDAINGREHMYSTG